VAATRCVTAAQSKRSRFYFGALQQRLTLARKFIAQSVATQPAILLVFDVLELAGDELTSAPLSDRRRALEQLLVPGHPCLQLVAHPPDIEVAQAWLGVAGLEGVVAKRVDRPYMAGRGRDWVKSSVNEPSTAPL
jgi:bifunctional non-homologous end joining protein LigD